MIQAKIVSNIKFPKIDLQSDLEYVARDIIIPDIVDGIDKSMAINGGRLPDNEPSTRDYKAKYGLGNKPLVATGTLRSSFYYKLVGFSKVMISIRGNRKKIGGYLQNDGKSGKFYRFFGISIDAYKRSMDYMKKKLERLTSGRS